MASVRDADLAATKRVELPKDGDVSAAVLEYAKAVDVPVVVPSGIALERPVGGDSMPWRLAVARLAAAAKLSVREYGSVLALAPDAGSLPYAAPLTLALKDVDIVDFAKALAGRVKVAFVVAGDVKGRVSCELTAASWRDALACVAKQLGVEVDGCGAVLVLRPAQAYARAPHVSCRQAHVIPVLLRATGKPLGSALANFAKGELGKIDAEIDGADPAAALAALATAVSCRVTQTDSLNAKTDTYVLTTRDASEARADVNAAAADLQTFAALVRTSTKIEVSVPDEDKQRFAVFATGTPLLDLLQAAARVTHHQLRVDPTPHIR